MTSAGVVPTSDRTDAGRFGLRGWVLVLAAWSLFVWATRIDNILADADLDALAKTWRIALSLSFVGPALVAGVLWWRRRSGQAARAVAVGLAWWTVAVWIVRGGGIAVSDNEAAFIVVHLVLAAVSIALSARVLILLRSGRP